MRFSGGWVKLYRKIEDTWIGSDYVAFCILVKLIFWANQKTTKKVLNGKLSTIKRGQVITSASEIAGAWGFDRKRVERKLKCLENDQVIDQLITPKGRLITVLNYSRYQDKETSGKDEVSNSETNKCPTDDQPVTNRRPLIEEYKNIRSKEENTNTVTDAGTPVASVQKGSSRKKTKKEISDHTKELRKKTREVYFLGYKKTMGVECPVNAKVNSMLAKLVDYLGPQAPNVAGYYFRFGQTGGGKFFGIRGFPLDLLLRDYQTIYAAYQQAVKKGAAPVDIHKSLFNNGQASVASSGA